MRNFILVKAGLHIVVTIAKHACDRVLKRVFKLSTHRLQILLVKYEYLRSSQLCKDQGIRRKLKKPVREHVLAILTTYMEPGIEFDSCSEMSNKADFKDFKAMTEKQAFQPVNLSLS